jgi:DNA processing protein
LLLAELCGHNRVELRQLTSLDADPRVVLEASDTEWRNLGIGNESRNHRRQWSARGRRHTAWVAAQRALEQVQRHGAELMVLGTEPYPRLLAEIHDPPPLLYIAGRPDCLGTPQFAVVGSRRCSAVGQRAAAEFSTELVRAGYSICSGMALGIDAAAHRAALAAGGQTLAVMATGIDQRYPRRHIELAAEVCQSGALLTEFVPGTPPRRAHFPQRNRLISGMSVGVLVVEAGLQSGSLITARCALEQNREVFALPHSIYHPGGRGCLKLLRDGAKLTETIDDLLEEVVSLRAVAAAASEVPQPPVKARGVWLQLGFEPVSIDELVASGAGNTAQVMSALQELELAGLVEQTGGCYMRRV